MNVHVVCCCGKRRTWADVNTSSTLYSMERERIKVSDVDELGRENVCN